MQPANPRKGYILGLSAYVIWGLFPLYFKAIASVPAVEIIIHRAIWSALFGGLPATGADGPAIYRSERTVASGQRSAKFAIARIYLPTSGSKQFLNQCSRLICSNIKFLSKLNRLFSTAKRQHGQNRNMIQDTAVGSQ